MKLDEIRKEWEEGMEVVAEKESGMELLVILKDNNGKYFIHRYWWVGNYAVCKVSVDLHNATAEEVMKYLLKEIE